jgi:hypothetical protein
MSPRLIPNQQKQKSVFRYNNTEIHDSGGKRIVRTVKIHNGKGSKSVRVFSHKNKKHMHYRASVRGRKKEQNVHVSVPWAQARSLSAHRFFSDFFFRRRRVVYARIGPE